MRVRQGELAQRYADALGARAAWFMKARNTVDLLAKLGIIGVHDRLVVCADDFQDAFLEHFRFNDLAFAADPTPAAFVAASDDTEEVAEAARLISEGTPASYAHPAGIHADRLFWFVNSIGCLGLRVPHIRAIADAAQEYGAILIVDNTVASSFGCNPLSLGANIALEALDRVGAGAMGEHAVAISVAPSATGRGRRRIVSPLSADAYQLLAVSLGDPDEPHAASLLAPYTLDVLEAGMDSLPARMQAHFDHAHAIAEYLACHPLVGSVFYPGLKTHPDRQLAPNVLLHGFGPAIDFSLQGDHAETMLSRHLRFLAACSCSNRSERAGGPLTRIGIAARYDLNYLRVFVGTDNPLAIVDSLDQALRLFCNPPEP